MPWCSMLDPPQPGVHADGQFQALLWAIDRSLTAMEAAARRWIEARSCSGSSKLASS